MDGFSSLQQWASKSGELLKVSRENRGQSVIPRVNGSIFHGNFQSTRKSTRCLLLFITRTTPTTNPWLLLYVLLNFELETKIATWNSTPRLKKIKKNSSVLRNFCYANIRRVKETLSICNESPFHPCWTSMSNLS